MEEGCQGCSLCGHGVVAGVSEETLATWNRSRQTRTYPKGEQLFSQGQPTRGLFCTYSGLVKLYRLSLDGNVQILRLTRGQEVLGHDSLLCQQAAAQTAEVIQEARICFVDRQVILQSMQADPRLNLNLARLLARDLQRVEERLFAVACLPTPGRLARLLLEISDSQGQVESLSRIEMAQLTGTSPESVSRILKQFQKVGALRLEKRKVFLLRPELLPTSRG